jgi:ribosomal protein L14E/L6E/L27E
MKTSHDFEIGQFVKSKAGRDKDKIFIVIDKVDENYLLLVDGDLRKAEKPKMKKIKHVAKINLVSDEIQSKLVEQKKITNAMVRREIEKLGLL